MKNKVEEARIKRGFTRRKLSDISKLSQDSIYKIERCGQEVKISSALALSKALNYSIEELFGNG